MGPHASGWLCKCQNPDGKAKGMLEVKAQARIDACHALSLIPCMANAHPMKGCAADWCLCVACSKSLERGSAGESQPVPAPKGFWLWRKKDRQPSKSPLAGESIETPSESSPSRHAAHVHTMHTCASSNWSVWKLFNASQFVLTGCHVRCSDLHCLRGQPQWLSCLMPLVPEFGCV